MKTVKVLYNKNLNMSVGKVASQVTHAVVRLNLDYHPDKVVVLEARQGKLVREMQSRQCSVQRDLGYTEVKEGAITAIAWEEEDKR